MAKVLDQEGEVLFVFHLTRAVSSGVWGVNNLPNLSSRDGPNVKIAEEAKGGPEPESRLQPSFTRPRDISIPKNQVQPVSCNSLLEGKFLDPLHL